MTKEIKQQFKELHNVDTKELENQIVGFTCKKFNSDEEVSFVGKVVDSYLYLSVEYPYSPDTNTCFCKETGVSPNVEEPRAYYILKDWWIATDDEIGKWLEYKEDFNKSITECNIKERCEQRAMDTFDYVLGEIIDSRFDMSIDWSNIFKMKYIEYGKTGHKG